MCRNCINQIRDGVITTNVIEYEYDYFEIVRVRVRVRVRLLKKWMYSSTITVTGNHDYNRDYFESQSPFCPVPMFLYAVC